jgi:hypothetical protein
MNWWIVAAFYIGFTVGAWLNRKPPVIKGAKISANLKVTPEVASQLTGAMVNQWLDDRGLVWMPKGAVFEPGKKVEK